ncbi:MAG: Curli production assembly/transport component CsgG [Chthonomonadales bacterium]|nr:Curli production assembly/transport component CsgG [Chthonomonadales bacterium]
MRKLSQFLMALALSLLIPTVSRAADPPSSVEKLEVSNRPKIAIADFHGADSETARFLAETVISNLASSHTLKPLDRPTVRRAITAEVKEADSEPTQEEIFRIGKRLHSAYFLTGSYLIQDEKLLVLAHIHNLKDNDTSDLQIRCTGARAELMEVAKQLADQIESQLSPPSHPEVHLAKDESPLPKEEASLPKEETFLPREEVRSVERPVERPAVIAAPVLPNPFAAFRAAGLCPAGVTSGAIVSAGDLARLLSHLSDTAAVHASFTLPRNNTPAPRMLALTGLVKLMLTPEEIADYRTNLPANLPADFAHVPQWGQPFLAAAVDHGWWDSGKAFQPTGNTNWAFIAIVAGKMGMVEPPREVGEEIQAPSGRRGLGEVRSAPAVELDNQIYTGLVIDGRDLRVERSQSPSIFDEDGNCVYPYEKHAPSEDYVGVNGMVDYNFDIGEQTRAGKHPLVVHALKMDGPGHDDLVISNEDAERIRHAQKRNQFLWRWKVVFLIPNN